MDLLPPEYKEQVKEKIQKHLDWLKPLDKLTRASKGYESAMEWMMATDNQKHLDLFFNNTRKYDKIRNEDTLQVFPEWKELFRNYEKN
jgi:hypothetical protein